MNRETIQPYIDDNWVREAHHPTKPLHIYNYSPQTSSAENWDKVTLKCRGLVLDDSDQIIINCPPKFFNSSQPQADHINLENALITEKLDGYYISIRKHPKYGLIVTSRGSFKNQYIEAAKNFLTPKVIDQLDPDLAYFCELCQNFKGDENIILTKHSKPRLICWAVRDEDGDEYPLDDCPIPAVRLFTPHQAEKYLTQKVEGIVIQDAVTYNRVKIKTEWFLEGHRIISHCTPRRAWELIRDGIQVSDLDIPDEFIPKMLEYEATFRKQIENQLQEAYKLSEDYELMSDKELALSDELSKFQKSLIFSLRKNKPQIAIDQIIKSLKPKG